MEQTFDPGDDSMMIRGAQTVVWISDSIKASDLSRLPMVPPAAQEA